MNNTFFELTPAEFKELRQFLESPYFNSNKKLPKLASVLKDLNSTSVYELRNKEILWTNVTGSKKFNNSGFKKMMSDFNAAYEKFLAYSEFGKDEHAVNVYLNRNLMSKGDYENINKISKEEIKKMSTSFLKNEDNYIFISKFYDDLYNCQLYANQNKFPEELVLKGKNLDYAFAFSKLHNYTALYNHMHNHKHGDPNDEEMIDEVLNYVEQNISEIKNFHPNITIPYFIVMFFKNNFDKKYLLSYEKYLKRIERRLDKERQYYFRLYLSSMYSALSERGDEEAWRKNFLNHKALADSNNLTLEKYLAPNIFIAIVFEALHAKEFTWTKKFIKDFSDKLKHKERNDSINLALSRLYLYMSRYVDAMNHINMVRSNVPLFYLNTKITYCFIYLEQNAVDLLIPLTDSMRKYAERNKNVPSSMKSNILTFLKYFKKLEKAKNDEFELKKLLDEIKNTDQRIPSKNLFIDKISMLASNL